MLAPYNVEYLCDTIRRGLTNYERYLGHAEARGAAQFLGVGRTAGIFPVVVRPASMAPATRGPVLLDCPGTGHRIHGELFAVDDRTLEAMDLLEGVRSGHYYKREVEVAVEADEAPAAPHSRGAEFLIGQTLRCIAYFFPANDVLQALPLHASYTSDLHELYAPGPVNQAVRQLCEAPAAEAGRDFKEG